jgi:UTP--glucose-1-phosphate uridylyltransferase
MKTAWQNLNGTNNMIALEEVPKAETSRYGIMSPENQNGNLVKAAGVVEKPKSNPPSNLALIGRYILAPSIFDYIEQTKSGAIGEIQITDAIEVARADTPLYGYLYQGERFDCGTREAFVQTQKRF